MEQLLTLIRRVESRHYPCGSSAPYGLYQCKCGREKEIAVNSVKRRRTRSCGVGCSVRNIPKRPSSTKGKFRLYQSGKVVGAHRRGIGKTENYTRYIMIDIVQLGEIFSGIVPSELIRKMSIADDNSIIIH